MNRKLIVKLAVILGLTLMLLISFTACSPRPSGTYTATGLLGVKQTAVFKNDIVEMQNILGGKQVYKYEIRDNRTEIILTDVVSGRSKILSFKYIKDPACVVIDGTAYYR
jgi:hypothetical protein